MASISIGTGIAVALGAIFLSSSRTRQRAASPASSIAAPAEAETEAALQSPPEGDEFEAWRAQRQWTRFAIDAVVLSSIGAAIVYVLAKENVDFVGELAKVFPREAALLARLASRQRQGGE
jgi:hypothetical protein